MNTCQFNQLEQVCELLKNVSVQAKTGRRLTCQSKRAGNSCVYIRIQYTRLHLFDDNRSICNIISTSNQEICDFFLTTSSVKHIHTQICVRSFKSQWLLKPWLYTGTKPPIQITSSPIFLLIVTILRVTKWWNKFFFRKMNKMPHLISSGPLYIYISPNPAVQKFDTC